MRLLALAPLLAACTALVPPAPMMALQGVHEPTHSTSLTAVAGASSGSVVDPAVGGGLRVSHRFSPELAAGAEGVAGVRVSGSSTLGAFTPALVSSLYAGRAQLQYNPLASRHVAFTLGLGGGALDTGIGYLTFDFGARLSGRFVRDLVEPFVGAVGAISGTVALPAPTTTVDPAFGTTTTYTPHHLQTFFAGGDVGLVLHVTGRFDLAADVLVLVGASPNTHDTSVLVVPTLGARYRFGGADDPNAR